MASKRILRVGEEIKHSISKMIVEGRIRDPRVHWASIVEVKVSPDLQVAMVYFSVWNPEISPDEVGKGLKSASSFMRSALSKELDLRYTPSLSFKHDNSSEQGSKIDSLLQKIKEEREGDV